MVAKIYTGSVKDVHEEVPATAMWFGRGFMYFEGDPFSVFDYGKLPWHIKGKGEGLWKVTKRFCTVLESNGIPTHFQGDPDSWEPRKVPILLARMLGYSDIKAGETIVYRVPIECVYSKVVTPVASLHKRLMTGKAKPEDYGLERAPERGETVILPEVETSYSTKIETTDVYKGLAAMAELAGLVGNEPQRLDALTIAAADALFGDAEDTGLILADGKFEYVMGPGRNLIVADTGYTWDENRFLFQLDDGRHVDVSKQLPRNIYTIMGWKSELKAAQKEHPDDKSRWPAPPVLTDRETRVCVGACGAVRAALTREPGCDKMLEAAAQDAMDVLDDLKEKYQMDETGAEI